MKKTVNECATNCEYCWKSIPAGIEHVVKDELPYHSDCWSRRKRVMGRKSRTTHTNRHNWY